MQRKDLYKCIRKIETKRAEAAENYNYYFELVEQVRNTKKVREKNEILWEMVQVCLNTMVLLQRALYYADFVIDYYKELDYEEDKQ